MKYKQVILIRMDLDMSCGKKCVQVAHASMMTCDDAVLHGRNINTWKEEGMRKIVLKITDLKSLNEFNTKIHALGLVTHIVVDHGLTQLEPNTITALGVEPVDVDSDVGKRLDEITKHLKLL